MQKSNKLKLGLLAVPLALVAVAAVSCGKEHTHTYSDEWAFHAASHWHPSTCSHDTVTNKAGHIYTETVIPPSVTSAGYTLYSCACGYSYTSDSVDSLPVEGDYRFDENGHWKPVLSGEADVKEHKYAETVVAPTCSTYGYTKHTCECGYWYATNPVEPTAHEYDETVWGNDENGHWHPALCCGAKTVTAAHNYTEKVVPATCDDAGYTEFTCIDCGYSYKGREVKADHTYSDTLKGDEYEHWREATCTHEGEKTDIADHFLIGNGNVCAVCGKEVKPRLAFELSANGEYYVVTGMGCIDTTDITIPAEYRGKPVQEIGVRAFKDAKITSVTFEGNNLNKIGTEAFAGAGIASVTLPSGIEEIGTKAFANTAITSLSLGASLKSIGNAAFRDCKNLQTVTLEGELAALPPYAFEGCSALTSVSGAKLKTIGAQAFANCEELTTLDVSELQKVEFAAFAGCTKFAPATMPLLAETDEYAFSGTAIQTITLPELTQLANNLFKDCVSLQSVTLVAESIGNSAFEGCTALNAVELSGTVLVGENAFKNCAELASLTLPETVIRVGTGAFTGTQLITQDGGVSYAANIAISANENVGEVTLKDGTVGIADGAFKKTHVTAVSLGTVRFIGVDAFREADGLSAITFTESVQYIGANAFRKSGLTTVTVPATVLSVGDNAFYDCEKLTAVTVNAKEIGKFAFSYTGVNRSLNSPVKERPSYAKLATVTLGEGVEVIGSNAFQYTLITSITLPESLKEIGMYAFAQTELASITIPAQVTRIGQYAFYASKITSATFASATGWKAGTASLNLATPATNATYLKTTYVDIDWIKE